MQELPCLVCGKDLEAALSTDCVNQPWGANTFRSHGHYGSTAFDEIHTYLEVNICSNCMITAADQQRIYVGKPVHVPAVSPILELWEVSPEIRQSVLE